MKVLFVPTYHQSLKTFFPIIKILNDNYGIESTILIKNDFKHSESLCKSEKIKYVTTNRLPILIESDNNDFIQSHKSLTYIFLKIKTILRSNYFIRPFYELVYQLKNQLMIQRKIYNTNLKLIKRENPSMIIVLNDYQELIIINIAMRLGIKTLTLGWSNNSGPRFFAKRKLFNNEKINCQLKLFLLKLIIPNSVFRLNDRYILLVDLIQSLAYKINSLKYILPGEVGKLTNTVTATSTSQKKLILSYGVNSSKVILNGDNQSDFIFRVKNESKEIQEKMINELSINDDDIVVLIAIPDTYNKRKSMLHNYRKSLVSILETIFSIDKRIKVIAKVHPKDNINDYLFIEDISKNIILIKKYNMPYVLVVSSLFIVHNSSSIIDAMALGVPIITYNLRSSELINQKLYSEEYKLEKTAIQVFEKRELKKKVNSLLFNKNYLNHTIKKQFTILKKYAIIDGQCVARNVSTILDILNQKKLKTSKY